MIIQTTTLDTQEKVIAIYGGTEWTRLDDRFLVGAGTAYAVNSTGGSADAIIPYHRHSISAWKTTDGAGAHTHKVSDYILAEGGGSYTTFGLGSGVAGAQYTASAGAHNHTIPATNTQYVGGNTTNANLPPYKAVYIWERTA